MKIKRIDPKEFQEFFHVPLVDLEAHVPKNQNYFFDDCHYTKKGNQKVARTIFEFIKSKKLIE